MNLLKSVDWNLKVEELNRSEEWQALIRGVTLDFGGTLALGELNREDFRNELFEYVRSLGFSGRKHELDKAGKGMLERLMKARSRNREIRLEDLYQGMLFKLGLHPKREYLDYIHRLYINSFKVELIPRVEEVLKTLSGKYKLAVISNAMSDVPRYTIKRFGLEKYLDTVVISRDLGIRKPDPEIFKFTLVNLGVESLEAIHVGDSLESDVQGAKNAGMKAVWLKKSIKEMNTLPDYTIHSIKELTSLL